MVINGKETDLPGYGTFKFLEKLRLTKQGYNRLTCWKILSWMADRSIKMTYHKNKNRFIDDYFSAVAKGQEFVIDENDKVTEWAQKIIENNYVYNE